MEGCQLAKGQGQSKPLIMHLAARRVSYNGSPSTRL